MDGINLKLKEKNGDEEPYIVIDFIIGNTRIKIADNYCRDKTPEDVQRILREPLNKSPQ